MAELGFFGVHVDGYGCRKTSHSIYGLICQELAGATAGSGRCFLYRIRSSCIHPRLWVRRAEAKWLPEMAVGKAIDVSASPSLTMDQTLRHEDGGDPARRSIHPERDKDVDHNGSIAHVV